MNNRLVLFIVCIFFILSGCNWGKQEISRNDSISIAKEVLADTSIELLPTIGLFSVDTSMEIKATDARTMIYNYAQDPIDNIAYINGGVPIKIKYFEIDSAVINGIGRLPVHVRGLRCYLAKKTGDAGKKDYTLVFVPYDNSYHNLVKQDGSLVAAYDWHKPGPKSSESSVGGVLPADTLGGDIK